MKIQRIKEYLVINDEFVEVITRRTTLWGACYCRVYSDGTIEYRGKLPWQQSLRQQYRFEDRLYNSTLLRSEYEKIMNVCFRGVLV